MRIVQVSPWFYPHLGGVESHVRSLSRELVRRGHEVTVVSTRHRRDVPSDETIDGIRIRRVAPRAVLLRTPVAPRMRAVLRSLSADILHAHSPPPLSAHDASVVAESRAIPFAVTYHCDVELPSPFGRFIESMYRRSLGRSTLRRADRVVVTTRTYAATSRTVWRFTPTVIPNAVDPRRFSPEVDGSAVRAKLQLPPHHPIVLLVGRIVPHKGIEHLLEAARGVPGATFVIAGAGSSLDAMRRLARTFGVESCVRFLGRVPEARLPEVYASCDVFVLPSVSRLEAFGIVALEAMASGKPVVVADIPGVREVIEDGVEGLLADPINPQDLAEKIGRLVADPGLRHEMGRRGREKALSSFSIEAVTDRIVELYEAMLADRADHGTMRKATRSPA
jgi:glycosyltransferase involved in cell wall biosynthesis